MRTPLSINAYEAIHHRTLLRKNRRCKVKTFTFNAVATGAILGAVVITFPSRSLQAEVAWHTNPQAAQVQAQQSGRPLLVFVGTDACHYCVQMKRNTWSDGQVERKVSQSFVPLHIDNAQWRQLVQQLRVRGLPTVLVLAPDGRELGRVAGYQSPAQIQQLLKRCEAPSSDIAVVRRR